jgi:putative transposase
MKPTISGALLDELLKSYAQPGDLLGPDGLLTELENRCLQDLLINCVDGLTSFAQALESSYPKCRIQRGIVHQLRNSLRYVNWKYRKAITADLKTIDSAPTEEVARIALAAFHANHDAKHPANALKERMPKKP